MTVVPSRVSVTDSTSVQLNCTVSGAPVARVVWKWNGLTIVSNNKIKTFDDKHSHYLIIKEPKREDRGMFVSIGCSDSAIAMKACNERFDGLQCYRFDDKVIVTNS